MLSFNIILLFITIYFLFKLQNDMIILQNNIIVLQNDMKILQNDSISLARINKLISDQMVELVEVLKKLLSR